MRHDGDAVEVRPHAPAAPPPRPARRCAPRARPCAGPAAAALRSLRVVQSHRVSTISSSSSGTGVAGEAAHGRSRSSPSRRCGSAGGARPASSRRRRRRWSSAAPACARASCGRRRPRGGGRPRPCPCGTSGSWACRRRGRGRPDACGGSRTPGRASGRTFSTTAMVWASTSLWRWIGILLEPHRRELGQELLGQAGVDAEPQPGAGPGRA